MALIFLSHGGLQADGSAHGSIVSVVEFGVLWLSLVLGGKNQLTWLNVKKLVVLAHLFNVDWSWLAILC